MAEVTAEVPPAAKKTAAAKPPAKTAPFDAEQQTRVEALKVAQALLETDGEHVGDDAGDMLAIANYIVHGLLPPAFTIHRTNNESDTGDDLTFTGAPERTTP